MATFVPSKTGDVMKRFIFSLLLCALFSFNACQDEISKTNLKTLKSRKSFSVSEKTTTERPTAITQNKFNKTMRETLPIVEDDDYTVVQETYNDNSYRVQVNYLLSNISEFPTLLQNGEPQGMTQMSAPDVAGINQVKSAVYENNTMTMYNVNNEVVAQQPISDMFPADAVFPGQENQAVAKGVKLTKQELPQKYTNDNFKVTELGNGLYAVENNETILGFTTRSVINFDNMLIQETVMLKNGKLISRIFNEYIDIETNQGIEKATKKIVTENYFDYDDGSQISVINEKNFDNIKIEYFEE
ncbi:hypothetical protein JNM05_14330 [bacterium]|nr:hypothetical protein [bacterium]